MNTTNLEIKKLYFAPIFIKNATIIICLKETNKTSCQDIEI